MALVAYDDSDIDDSDEDVVNENRDLADTEALNNHKANQVVTSDHSDDSTLFSKLPQPKKDFGIENDDLFLHKKDHIPKDQVVKKPPRVKITIPSLSKSADEKPVNNMDISVPNKSKTRLLSMLPEPKFVKTLPDNIETKHVMFIPRSVDSNKVKAVKSTQSHKTSTTPIVNCEAYGSDESDTEDISNSDKNTCDFFSLNSAHTEPLIVTEVINKVNLNHGLVHTYNVEPGSSHDKQNHTDYNLLESVNHDQIDKEEVMCTSEPLQEECSSKTENENHDSMQLDEEAIIKLCGRKGRYRREDVQIIDINQKEILPDSREWLLKAITEDNTKRVSSKRRGDEPTHVQKRKHQITYLAHQAKANEQDLQNQWSNNRMSRRQTQSKYGF